MQRVNALKIILILILNNKDNNYFHKKNKKIIFYKIYKQLTFHIFYIKY
jgi:hypothetical protein